MCLNASKKKRESVNACDSEALAGRAACSLQHPKNTAWHQIWHVGIFLVAKKAAYAPKPMNQRARSHVHIAHMRGFKSLLVMRLTSFFPSSPFNPSGGNICPLHLSGQPGFPTSRLNHLQIKRYNNAPAKVHWILHGAARRHCVVAVDIMCIKHDPELYSFVVS